MTDGNQFSYRAFGVNIASEIELPELAPGGGDPEVEISLGPVPEALPGPVISSGVRYAIGESSFLLRVDDIARYFVTGGRRIAVEPAPGAGEEEVRLFLLGSAVGALLHQRGVLPLHGSAVEVDGAGVVFLGESGAGKSTLAAAFARRGYRVLADDITALVLDADGQAWIQPGSGQLKLWADATRKLDHDTGSLQRVRPQLEKYGLPLGNSHDEAQVPFRHAFVLRPSNSGDLDLEQIAGVEKVNALVGNIYRLRFIGDPRANPHHFTQCAAAAQSLSMFRITRPLGSFMLDELVALVEARLPG